MVEDWIVSPKYNNQNAINNQIEFKVTFNAFIASIYVKTS